MLKFLWFLKPEASPLLYFFPFTLLLVVKTKKLSWSMIRSSHIQGHYTDCNFSLLHHQEVDSYAKFECTSLSYYTVCLKNTKGQLWPEESPSLEDRSLCMGSIVSNIRLLLKIAWAHLYSTLLWPSMKMWKTSELLLLTLLPESKPQSAYPALLGLSPHNFYSCIVPRQ